MSRGAVLYETLFLAWIFFFLLSATQIAVIIHWNRKLELLEEQRIPYDGTVRWIE